MDLDPKTWWYVTRASGFVAWVLLAVAVLWGLFLTNKTLQKSTAPAWVLDLHRHLGGLAVVFVAVHVGALPLDGYTHWGWSDLFVPMSTRWHPLAVAWGIVGLYLLVAIEVTSLLGRRFPKKWWRRVHMLSFPLYVLASIHLFAAGTDSANRAVQAMVLIVSTLIVFLAGVRGLAVAKPRETRSNPRVAAAKARATEAPVASVTASTGDLLPVSAPPAAVKAEQAASQTPSTSPVAHGQLSMQPPSLEARVAKLRAGARAARERVRDQSPSPVGSGPP